MKRTINWIVWPSATVMHMFVYKLKLNLFDLLWICCTTIRCTENPHATNPQQIDQVEFELQTCFDFLPRLFTSGRETRNTYKLKFHVITCCSHFTPLKWHYPMIPSSQLHPHLEVITQFPVQTEQTLAVGTLNFNVMYVLLHELAWIIQKNLERWEFHRRLNECERLRDQLGKKLITRKDMAPDRCLIDDSENEVLFSKTVSPSSVSYIRRA
jgi:hypothetical protein